MELILIAAVAKNGTIGKDGHLPWDIPEDYEHYRNTVEGKPLIIGRSTYDTMKKIPNSEHIVLSKSKSEFEAEDTYHAENIEEALDIADGFTGADGEVFVLGGSQVYEEFLHIGDRMIISHIHKEYEGDTFFPEWDEDNWEVVEIDPRDEFDIVTYERATHKTEIDDAPAM